MQIITQASGFKLRTAILSNGRSYSYGELLDKSATIASGLLGGREDLSERRIAFLLTPSFQYTAVLWGVWRAGGIAVPLCVSHPLPSIEYVLQDTKPAAIVADELFYSFLEPLAKKCAISIFSVESLLASGKAKLPEILPRRRAMILYTSGTTSKPKGVVSCHRHIEAQIKTLVSAWYWEKDDSILNVLPLHHVHGIINVMCCALWVGACCEFLPKFSPATVWKRLCSGDLTLFMGVPTMYYQLISHWESVPEKLQKEMSAGVSGLRLMVSGSAALPESVLHKWKEISGHVLLERYGMTEIGMGLTNPYNGERKAGHVGLPFEGVSIKLVDQDFAEVPEGEPGEILIKGPSIFEEYWQKPEASREAFTADGWFKTGDMAVLNKGSYKILGRTNVDIIKSGGYKISALEIEEVLRKHAEINDCAVVGIPDEEWGEIIAAMVVLKNNELNTGLLTDWILEKLPSYKIPRIYHRANELPRNVLGKVTKTKIKELFIAKNIS